ncbi:helix-turn-helix transcriptional regulator [Pseudoalteromonas sp. BZB3]|uniref:helix-turn-helix domain-containing protein n=1 Tax=Pseudoalteromonas sp. BZB3 TaxID=3136670 RepID=UPI0032C4385C
MRLNPKTIKQLRDDKNWTQQSLADACGLSLRTIQRVEKEGVASRETMMSLCAVFEVKQSSLINLDEAEANNSSQTTTNMKQYLMMFGTALLGGLAGAGIMYLLIG